MESSIKLVRGVSANGAPIATCCDVVSSRVVTARRQYANEILPRKECHRSSVANVDVGIIVMSAVEPEFSTHLVDRFLLLRRLDVKPVIMITKTDLLDVADVTTRGH